MASQLEGEISRAMAEVVRFGASGEKHIADVQTEHGLTIEFQHSSITPQERAAREQFYGNMAWVVDGSRLKRNLPRFLEGMRSSRTIIDKWIRIVPFPEEVIPRSWLGCGAPVFIDFEGSKGVTEPAPVCRALWCVLPQRVRGHAVILNLAREGFVELALQRTDLLPADAIIQSIEAEFSAGERREKQAALAQQYAWLRSGRRRRF